MIVYLNLMRTTSYSELRRTLAAAIDAVNADREPVLITRDGGKPGSVLMSLEDFTSYEETAYLLANPTNAQRLLEAPRALNLGRGSERELLD